MSENIFLFDKKKKIFTVDYLATTEEPSCPENEHYTCGTRCVETCTYKPTVCTKDCLFGCFCNEGYVRKTNETGSPCVKREECNEDDESTEKKCCKNQEYLTCGSSCPPTCNDFSYPLPKPLKICTANCVTGCFCKEGYYLKGKHRCVPPEKCCRRRNERFNTCGTACPETCDHKPLACTKQCVRGCFCASSDFVRRDNSTNSPCIPRSKCPK